VKKKFQSTLDLSRFGEKKTLVLKHQVTGQHAGSVPAIGGTMVHFPRIVAVLIAAVCILSLLPGAAAMTISLDPLSASSISSVSMSAGAMRAASANDNYPISVEQAKNSVRVFMGNLSLQPTLVRTGSLEVGNYYYLSAGADTFSVNQNTGVVEFVHFGANDPRSDILTLTRDQAYAKATEYAGTKYEGFSDKTWKLVVDTVDESGTWVYNKTSKQDDYIKTKTYDFVLREEKNHVLLPSIVHVRINAQTGTVVDYWGVDRILTVSTLKNTVTLSNATKSAEDYVYSDFTVTSSEGYLAVITQNQNVENLAWVIKLTGSYKWNTEYVTTYVVVVDATDGSVLGAGWNMWPESRISYH
jgi:hypothetical protein